MAYQNFISIGHLIYDYAETTGIDYIWTEYMISWGAYVDRLEQV